MSLSFWCKGPRWGWYKKQLFLMFLAVIRAFRIRVMECQLNCRNSLSEVTFLCRKWSYAGWLFDHGWSWRKSILCWWWRADDSRGLSACPDGTFRSFLSEPAAFHRDSRHLWTLFEVEMATLTVSCLFPRRDWLEVPFQRTSSLTSMGLSSDWPPFLNEQVVVRWAYGMASPWVVVLVFQLMAPFGLSPRRLVLYLGFRIGWAAGGGCKTPEIFWGVENADWSTLIKKQIHEMSWLHILNCPGI